MAQICGAGRRCVPLIACNVATGQVFFGEAHDQRFGRIAFRSADGQTSCAGDKSRGMIDFKCSGGLTGHAVPKITGKRGEGTYRGLLNRHNEGVIVWTGRQIDTYLKGKRRTGPDEDICRQAVERERRKRRDREARNDRSEDSQQDEGDPGDEEAAQDETAQEEVPQETPAGSFQADVGYTARRLGMSRAQAFALLKTTSASEAATNLIAGILFDRRDICNRLSVQFRVDCLRDGYRNLAGVMARRGDYAEAQKALNTTADALDRIVRRQKTRATSSIDPRNGRPKSRNYQGVKPRGVSAAEQALGKAAGSLLRSAPAGDARQVHFHRIAQAFDGDALLLRS